MVPAEPKARADLKPGAVYAVAGQGGWVYYGQVAAAGRIAFLRRRDRAPASCDALLADAVMSQVAVDRSSIGAALRCGAWVRLGRRALHPALAAEPDTVQWPFGTLTVTVWSGACALRATRVEDPGIQQLEVMASWDAVRHVPARLAADFGGEPAEWWVGGPVWRQCRVKEAYAARFPDNPVHRLPADWVGTANR